MYCSGLFLSPTLIWWETASNPGYYTVTDTQGALRSTLSVFGLQSRTWDKCWGDAFLGLLC